MLINPKETIAAAVRLGLVQFPDDQQPPKRDNSITPKRREKLRRLQLAMIKANGLVIISPA